MQDGIEANSNQDRGAACHDHDARHMYQLLEAENSRQDAHAAYCHGYLEAGQDDDKAFAHQFELVERLIRDVRGNRAEEDRSWLR